MNTAFTTQASSKFVLRRYHEYGWLGGGALSSIVGVLVSGPHFFDWPVLFSLGVIVGGGAVGALLGRLAVGIAVGSLAGGVGAIGVHHDTGHVSGGDGGHYGGGDGGGDS
jgi:hypothetical protein